MRPLLPHTSLLQHTLKLERVINWAQAVPWEELQLSEQPCMQAGYFPLYFAILKWHLLYPSSHIKIMHLSSPYLLVCAVFVIFRHFILVLAESSLYCWNFQKKKIKTTKQTQNPTHQNLLKFLISYMLYQVYKQSSVFQGFLICDLPSINLNRQI